MTSRASVEGWVERDVSCMALELPLRTAKERQIDLESLTVGTGYALAQLCERRRYIPWRAFAAFQRNLSQHLTDADFVAIGKSFPLSAPARALCAVARLLFGPRDFYRWIVTQGEGAGDRFFPCLRSRLVESPPNKITIYADLPHGFEVCRPFFLIAAGTFAAMPRMLGLPEADVQVEYHGNSAAYHITYPVRPIPLAWLRRAVMWPFATFGAARGLRAANRELHDRLHELETTQKDLLRAHSKVHRQAELLKLGEQVSRAVKEELDLDRSVHHIVTSMLDSGRFEGVELQIRAEIDGKLQVRDMRAGDFDAIGVTVRRPLSSKGQELGHLIVRQSGTQDLGDEGVFLDTIVPSVAVAVAHALTYSALDDYRRNLEVKVEARAKELKDAHFRLEQAHDALKDVVSARERLLANLNHEIRTPLTAMMLAIFGAQRNGTVVGEDAERFLAVEAAARSLMRTADELLLLAQSREGKLKVHAKRGDFAACAKKQLDLWAPVAKDRNLALRFQGPDVLFATFDPVAIERILGNLLSNAFKFTLQGEICVAVRDADDAVELCVQDSGPGIEASMRQRVFGRFEQGSSLVNLGHSGTGIGLSVVRELVAGHGGSIVVECPENGGTIFRIGFPKRMEDEPVVQASRDDADASQGVFALRPDAFRVAAPRALDPPAIAECTNGAAEGTVLVAEDDPIIRRGIVDSLRGSYRVIAASNGEQALALAKEHAPDILVTDIAMPKSDGFELLNAFRALPENRLAPVILLSAHDRLDMRVWGLSQGAVDFVAKPFAPEELLARVRSQLHVRELALRLHDAEQIASLAVLSSGLAHELRNPVNGIVNGVECLVSLLDADQVNSDCPISEIVGVVQTCVEQLRTASSRLLDLRPDVRKESRSHRVHAILDAATRVLGPRLDGVVIRRNIELDRELECDAGRMTQVFVNLLENSAHALDRSDPWVEVTERFEDDRYVVEIGDSGAGIPVPLRARVFDPFFTTKPQGEGTGLGLTLCRRILSDHGGAISVRERVHGTAFVVSFPRERVRVATDDGLRDVAPIPSTQEQPMGAPIADAGSPHSNRNHLRP